MSPKDCEGHGHYFTPAQAKIRCAVQFYKHIGIKYFQKDVFQTFNIFYCRSYKFLHNNLSLCQLQNNLNQKKDL